MYVGVFVWVYLSCDSHYVVRAHLAQLNKTQITKMCEDPVFEKAVEYLKLDAFPMWYNIYVFNMCIII